MAGSVNVVVLVGNLTRDPELRAMPSGTSVCRLGIAVNERTKDPTTGEWGERPNYFDIDVFGAMGENCAKYLAKGRQVAIEGRLRWRSWESQEGQKRSAVSVVANNVQFIGARLHRARNDHHPVRHGRPEPDEPVPPGTGSVTEVPPGRGIRAGARPAVCEHA